MASGQQENAFPPFDPALFPSQIFWLAVIFFGMYLALSRSILPRLGAVIERRRDRIANDLDRAAHLGALAEKARITRDRKIAQSHEKARAIKLAAKADMIAEIAAETEAFESDEKEHLAEAAQHIARAEEKAQAGVEAAAREAMALIIEKLTGVPAETDVIDAALAQAYEKGKG